MEGKPNPKFYTKSVQRKQNMEYSAKEIIASILSKMV